MDTSEKLAILSAAAKYDVSCSSSGSKNRSGSTFGNTHSSGICHSWTADGRCVSLLKVLMTNYCQYNCAYCYNRRENDIKRASFEPRELAQLTIEFYKRNYIEGLFLSSGIIKNPDYTMERLLSVVEILRFEMGFGGYIHLKGIPGASQILIDKAAKLVDRMSVNIELPSKDSLRILAPDKDHRQIFLPMKNLSLEKLALEDSSKKTRQKPMFLPAGQTTQMIIGASPETDSQIVHLTDSLYKKFQLKRVYYSAYIPINKDNLLPALNEPPLLREHRLYQADWLLRFYEFEADEIFKNTNGNLDMLLDPKAYFAVNNLHLFPIEINKGSKHDLLKVPGIGPSSVKRILEARNFGPLSFYDLKKIGVIMKKARYFITCQGKTYDGISIPEKYIESILRTDALEKSNSKKSLNLSGQLSFIS